MGFNLGAKIKELEADVKKIEGNYSGTHNKPYGTYTGNGIEEKRVISASHVGGVCVITSRQGTAILTGNGALIVRSSNNSVLWTTSYYISNEGIIMFGTDETLNASGNSYSYYFV